jgi:hypothetical protein
VYADLVGDGPEADVCAGCDGKYSTGDVIRARIDPLPSLEVILRDDDGDEIDRTETGAEDSERLGATFEVDEPADFEVELAAVPEGWELCPDLELTAEVSADDFDESGEVTVTFGLWQGCEPPTEVAADEPATAEPTAEPTEDADAVEDVDEDEDEDAGAEPEVELDEELADEADEPTDEADEADEPTDEADEADQADEPVETVEDSLGSIGGLAYVDANEDGLLGPDEQGLVDVPVHLEGIGMATYVFTGEDGEYEYIDLRPGTYDIFVTVPAGYRLTTIDRYSDVRVDGEIVAGIDFGLALIEETSVVPTAVPTPSPALPSTGVLPESSGRVLLGLAALIGVLGLLGLSLDGQARRS